MTVATPSPNIRIDAEGQPYALYALTRTHNGTTTVIRQFDISFYNGRPMFEWHADFIMDALNAAILADMDDAGTADRGFGSWHHIVNSEAWRVETAREITVRWEHGESWSQAVWLNPSEETVRYRFEPVAA